MKRLVLAAFAIAAAAFSLPAIAGHDYVKDRTTVCERTAQKMFQSCRFEVNEEWYATNAKCINFGDPLQRWMCKQEASTAYRDDRRGCRDQREAREEVCKLLGENRYDPEALLDTDNFYDLDDATLDPIVYESNPYFSLEPGHTYVARAGEVPEEGENFEETIVVTVTDEVREILGVNCRIVVDIVLVENDDGELEAVEVTDDYYALAKNGDVHYCGEVARNFEDGALNNLDGSFEAGRDYAKSGILIKAAPISGTGHRQEYLPGEAEDVIQYLNGDADPTSVGPGEGGETEFFPCIGQCVKTEEFIPPEPGAGEFKYFKAGTGFVLGVGLEDGEPTGERDEVLCIGDSLDVLNDDPNCGIDDAGELLDLLCELSPVAFCGD
jgi:hypothetical protein